VTTLHVRSSQQLSSVASALGTFVGAFCGSGLSAMWSTETECNLLVTDELSPTTGRNTAQHRQTLSIKGTGTGNALSPRTAVVMGLRTALPTRAGRGRMYWPAPDDSHLTTTGLLASTDAQSLATDMSSALSSLSAVATPVIFHRGDLTSTDVTEVTVGQVLGDQRRRTNKVSANYQTSDL